MTDDSPPTPVRDEEARSPLGSSGDNPVELMKQIEQTEGWKIITRIRQHAISYHVFKGNYEEIRRSLQAYHDSNFGMRLWDVKNRSQLDLFRREMIRLFHNYVASGKSLVEHTRNFVTENYSGSKFEKDYLAKVDLVFHNPFCSFVMKLRDFLLHFGLPSIAANLRFERDKPIEYRLLLDVASLRKWRGWKDSKEYLETLGNEVEMDVVVNDYNAKVSEFYEWFGKTLQEVHSKEFEETNRLQNRLRELTAGDVIS